jgi:replicative DNA helicase
MSQLIDSSISRQFDRLPPHSVEAEMCLLASMMLDVSKDTVGQIVQMVEEEAFFQADHQILFKVLKKLYEANRPIDAMIVREELIKQGLLDEIGGIEYLAAILSSVPNAAHGPHYAEIVKEKALLRQLIAASSEILREAYAPMESAEAVLENAEKRIFQIAERKVSGSMTAMEDVLHEVFEMIETKGQRGIETGFFELDDMLNGLQKGEMIVVAARPSMGKCLAADAEVVLTDGSVVTMAEIYRRKQAEVFTLGQDLKLRTAQPSAFVDDGIKPVFRVTTRLGRSVTTTLTHPFLTLDGWTRLEDLKVGDYVGVPRRLEAFGTADLPDCRAKLLGYLIGDGGLTDTTPEFTNADEHVRADFVKALAEFGGVAARESTSGGTRTATLCVSADRAATAAARDEFADRLNHALETSGRSARSVAMEMGVSPSLVWQWVHGKSVPREETLTTLSAGLGVAAEVLAPGGIAPARKSAPNPLTRWLDELGLWGKGSREKFVPAVVFTAPRRAVALFLNRLFATDGWATVLATGQSQIGYATVSHRLARQVQHLLLRFGIIAAVRRKSVKYQGHRREAWQVNITDARSIETFIAEIGMFANEAALAKVRRALATRRYQTNRDLVPASVWGRIERAKGAMSWGELGRRLGLGEGCNLHAGRRGISRDRLAKVAGALASPELAAISASDVYWDRIESIEYLGKQQVYDLTIPQTHNFIANDVCVHNTAFSMNIIEHVAADSLHACAVFSLEMSKQQLAQRMLCSRGQIDAHKLRKGMLQAHEYAHLANVVGELAKAPIWVDDAPGLTPLELRAKCRRLKMQHDIKLIMIDYMQLMDNPGVESRQQQISEISRGIKAVARELMVPVIALSQLNRGSENRDGHRPRMSDLRESGSIEQDADVIALLHREDYYRLQEPDFVPDNIAEVIIAKQRNGPTGTVRLAFNNKSTRFENLSTQADPF